MTLSDYGITPVRPPKRKIKSYIRSKYTNGKL